MFNNSKNWIYENDINPHNHKIYVYVNFDTFELANDICYLYLMSFLNIVSIFYNTINELIAPR